MDWRLITGGVAITALISAFSYVRSVFGMIVSLVIVRHEIEAECALALNFYLANVAKRVPVGGRRFWATRFSMRHTGSLDLHVIEQVGMSVFILGWKPIVLAHSESNGVANRGLTVLRWFTDVDRLLTDTMNYANHAEKTSGAYRTFKIVYLQGKNKRVINNQNGNEPSSAPIHAANTTTTPLTRLVTCKQEDVGPFEHSFVSIDKLVLTSPSAIKFVKHVKNFMLQREYYSERDIPWKTGAHIVGPPGTGKTSLVRAIASELKIPLVCLDIATMDNIELRDHWATACQMAPCIVLIEDIHCIFKGREVIGNECQVTMDALLQCLSGVSESNGVISVITTNDFGVLDPALIRPGRAEYFVEMGCLEPTDAYKIIDRILGDWPDLADDLKKSLSGTITGADVQHRAVELALSRLANVSD